MRLKIDLHVHSAHSDGLGSVQEILKEATLKGLDGLAITDHDTLEGYREATSLRGDLLILPGYEVETDAGHVLVLGLEQLPPFDGKIIYEDLIRWARSLGGLTVLAHPAAGRQKLRRWRREKPNAVEVLNASYPNKYFTRSGQKIAETLELPAVGGSDAHHPKTVGDAYTVVEVNDRNADKVIEAIKQGSTTFEGELSPIHHRFRIGLGYLVKKLADKITDALTTRARSTR